MKAARFHARRDVRIDDIAKPRRLLADEVLVKTHLCGICGTDLHEYDSGPIFISEKPNAFSGASIPQILGHEFSGVIEEVGSGVRHLRAGDRVAIQPHMGPSDGFFGERGLHFLSRNGAATGLTWPWGGFAEYAAMKSYATVKMPDEMTFRQGAMVEPAAVAVTAVDRSGLQPGGSILITGGGPIGVLAAMAADAAGASRIILSEPNGARRDRIAALPISIELVDPVTTRVDQHVRQSTFEELGCDAAIECSGSARAIADCLATVRSQGTVVLIGLSKAKVEINPFDMIVRDIRLQGSLCYPTTLWPRIYSMIISGKLPVDSLVDDEIQLGELVEKGFKPLLDPKGSMLKILVSTSA